jgi:hypothetical protein
MKAMEMFRIAGVAGAISFALMGCSSSGSISDQYGTVSIEPIEALELQPIRAKLIAPATPAIRNISIAFI